MRRFDALHPVTVFCALLSTVVVSMLSMHPVLVLSSLVGATLAWAAVAPKLSTVLRALPTALLLVLAIALINPLLSQNGATVLLFVNDSRYTLEALLYGVFAGGMLLSVLGWCAVYSTVMTADKFMALFGRALPTLALTVSMALRFVPSVLRRMRRVRQAQRGLGLGTGKGLSDRIQSAMSVFVSVVRGEMEDAIVTSRSMRARGYGVRRRVVFVRESFSRGDAGWLVWITVLLGVTVAGLATGAWAVVWYPTVAVAGGGAWRVAVWCAWAALCLTPACVQWGGALSWQRSRSKI